jgi:ribokinase
VAHPRGPTLVVLGSLNVDLVLAGVRLPGPGETVTGGRLEIHQGGKGGNAALAAARALRGGPRDGAVAFVGAVGDDDHGRAALAALRLEGIAVDRAAVRPGSPTGVALIVVAPDGENQVAVAPGANATLTAAEAEVAVATLLEGGGGVLLASLEVPAAAVAAAARAAHAAGACFVLDPAPVDQAAAALLAEADVLTPNEGELAGLGGPAALRAARPELRLAITRGARGMTLLEGESVHDEAALAVAAVDATGAGDTFAGVLAAGLLEGRPLPAAAHRANVAAGLSVTVAGARQGMPTRDEIERAI